MHLRGILEALGAIGLLLSRLRRPAAWGLLAPLIALFRANLNAAWKGLTLGGAAVTPLWLRAPLQVFWIAVLWQTTLAISPRPSLNPTGGHQ